MFDQVEADKTEGFSTVRETATTYHIEFTSSDDTYISIDAENANELPAGSIFKSLDEASEFFKGGAAGYSPNGEKYDGL
ncbi:MAG: hypothetical protein ABWZ25_18055 [Chitinophagaceae bacterium]